MQLPDPFFTGLPASLLPVRLPGKLALMKDGVPHPLCRLAAAQLQQHLATQDSWEHNFGLSAGGNGTIIGKMFGVLVVQAGGVEIGYLAAFSGKLAGGNHHARFVPPVFDSLTEHSFLNKGMQELTQINKALKELQSLRPENAQDIQTLRAKRKDHSLALQQQLFDHYHFLNQAGEMKSLVELFKAANYKNPPAGAGECAGPKLLQYAFRHGLKPLALAEFWWGQSPKSATWQHGRYYPCCKEKCAPILAHMLTGLDQ